MKKDDVLCFIARRDGSSVPELMREFSAPYREVRELVAVLERDELIKRDGGLEYKPTERGKSEAKSIINIDTIATLVQDDAKASEGSAAPRDYASKWNGIAAEMYRTASSDDDDAGEREDIIDAEKTEKLLEELTEKSIAALEAEAKASRPKHKIDGSLFDAPVETIDYAPDFDDDDDEYGLDDKLLAEFDDDDDEDVDDDDNETDDDEEPRSVFDIFFGSDDDDDDGDTDGDK